MHGLSARALVEVRLYFKATIVVVVVVLIILLVDVKGGGERGVNLWEGLDEI